MAGLCLHSFIVPLGLSVWLRLSWTLLRELLRLMEQTISKKSVFILSIPFVKNILAVIEILHWTVTDLQAILTGHNRSRHSCNWLCGWCWCAGFTAMDKWDTKMDKCCYTNLLFLKLQDRCLLWKCHRFHITNLWAISQKTLDKLYKLRFFFNKHSVILTYLSLFSLWLHSASPAVQLC